MLSDSAFVFKITFLFLNWVCVICLIDSVVSSYHLYHMELHKETGRRRSLLCFPCSILGIKADFGASLSFVLVCFLSPGLSLLLDFLCVHLHHNFSCCYQILMIWSLRSTQILVCWITLSQVSNCLSFLWMAKGLTSSIRNSTFWFGLHPFRKYCELLRAYGSRFCLSSSAS